MENYNYFLISLALCLLIIHLVVPYPTIIFKRKEIK